jgi:hypothetical protein
MVSHPFFYQLALIARARSQGDDPCNTVSTVVLCPSMAGVDGLLFFYPVRVFSPRHAQRSPL